MALYVMYVTNLKIKLVIPSNSDGWWYGYLILKQRESPCPGSTIVYQIIFKIRSNIRKKGLVDLESKFGSTMPLSADPLVTKSTASIS